MKIFGKKPVALLAAGSFALALTSCKQMSAENDMYVVKNEVSLAQAWTQLMKKISKTLRGGFGGETPLGGARSRQEEEFDEDSGAGG